MLWFVFAILCAFCSSLRDVMNKKMLASVDEYVVSFAGMLFTLPILLPLLFIIEIPTLGPYFLPLLAAAGIIHTIAAVLYVKAINHGDLSVTIPMVSFSPVFLLVTAPLFLGEFPTVPGLIGVALTIAGAYILNVKERHKGVLEPFKALLREKGPRIALFVSFLWSITTNLDKLGYQNSSPIFWLICLNSFIVACMLPIILIQSRRYVGQIRTHAKKLFPLGVFLTGVGIFQILAIGLTLVVYAISVKRLSVLMSVIFGHYLFQEKGIRERLMGTITMIAGVILILVSSV